MFVNRCSVGGFASKCIVHILYVGHRLELRKQRQRKSNTLSIRLRPLIAPKLLHRLHQTFPASEIDCTNVPSLFSDERCARGDQVADGRELRIGRRDDEKLVERHGRCILES